MKIARFFILIVLLQSLIACVPTQANSTGDKTEKTLVQLGNFYYQTGNYEQAEESWQQSYLLSHDAKLLEGIAAAKVQQGRYAEALKTYQTLYDKTNLITYQYRIAYLQMMSGELKEAWLSYQKILSLNPHDTKVLKGLALLMVQNKNYETAKLCYQKAIAFYPEDASLLNNQGLLWALMGDYSHAKANLRKGSNDKNLYYIMFAFEHLAGKERQLYLENKLLFKPHAKSALTRAQSLKVAEQCS